MPLPIITVPESKLRKKSVLIEQFDESTFSFLKNLSETLVKKDNPQGVGLSAIQVGRPLRVFVTHLPPVFDLETADKHTPPPEIKLYINPEMIDADEKLTLGPDKRNPTLEGCLSIPALYGPVLRYQSIKMKYVTIKQLGAASNDTRSRTPPTRQGVEDVDLKSDQLIEKTEIFSNFYARVVQHEYDHLEGKLFTDYILKDKQDLYFDNGDKLIHIPKPNQLINW